MFRRILVAIDDSHNAQRALEVVRELVGEDARNVVLFHAYHVPPELAGLARHYATGDNYTGDAKQLLQEQAQALLERSKEQLALPNASMRMVSVEGKPGPAIVEAIDQENSDCVVLGRRGQSGMRGLLLGSVSDYVVHHSTRPVIIAP